MPGIADDEVADLLGSESDLVEMVAALDPALFELALDEVRRDRPPLDPDDGDAQDEQNEQRERDDSSRPAPTADARDDDALRAPPRRASSSRIRSIHREF